MKYIFEKRNTNIQGVTFSSVILHTEITGRKYTYSVNKMIPHKTINLL